MLLVLTASLLGIMSSLINQIIIHKNITKTFFIESIGIFVIIYITKTIGLSDFFIYYSTLIILLLSNHIFHKAKLLLSNVVFLIITTTFTITQIIINGYQYLLEYYFVSRPISGSITTAFIILLSALLIGLMYFLINKTGVLRSVESQKSLTIFNILLIAIIITTNTFITLKVPSTFYYETYLLLFINLAIVNIITFIFLFRKNTHERSIDYYRELTESLNERAKALSINNHNYTNIILTVNHLLNDEDYEALHTYIKEKYKE